MTKSSGKPEASTSKDVFTELYEQYMPSVFQYISYRVNDIHLAEDLTSDVFLKALKGFNRYCSDKASFFTWLLSIARHRIIDFYRTSSKKQTVPLGEAAEASSPGVAEEETIRKEELQRLQICLAGLAQQEQEIISLKFGAEMTNRQIAGMLSLSESNVGTIIYRTVRKLRDCFGGWQNG